MFGRTEEKSTLSNTLRTRHFNQSKSNVDIEIDQFNNYPSDKTAKALMDLILDLGESVMHSIPDKIRIELKKFIR